MVTQIKRNESDSQSLAKIKIVKMQS